MEMQRFRDNNDNSERRLTAIAEKTKSKHTFDENSYTPEALRQKLDKKAKRFEEVLKTLDKVTPTGTQPIPEENFAIKITISGNASPSDQFSSIRQRIDTLTVARENISGKMLFYSRTESLKENAEAIKKEFEALDVLLTSVKKLSKWTTIKKQFNDQTQTSEYKHLSDQEKSYYNNNYERIADEGNKLDPLLWNQIHQGNLTEANSFRDETIKKLDETIKKFNKAIEELEFLKKDRENVMNCYDRFEVSRSYLEKINSDEHKQILEKFSEWRDKVQGKSGYEREWIYRSMDFYVDCLERRERLYQKRVNKDWYDQVSPVYAEMRMDIRLIENRKKYLDSSTSKQYDELRPNAEKIGREAFQFEKFIEDSELQINLFDLVKKTEMNKRIDEVANQIKTISEEVKKNFKVMEGGVDAFVLKPFEDMFEASQARIQNLKGKNKLFSEVALLESKPDDQKKSKLYTAYSKYKEACNQFIEGIGIAQKPENRDYRQQSEQEVGKRISKVKEAEWEVTKQMVSGDWHTTVSKLESEISNISSNLGYKIMENHSTPSLKDECGNFFHESDNITIETLQSEIIENSVTRDETEVQKPSIKDLALDKCRQLLEEYKLLRQV